VIMLGTAVVLRAIGVPWPWGAIWLLACALVLAFEPMAWMQAGFWLSFVAVGLLMALDNRAERSPVDAQARLGGWQNMRRAVAGLWHEQRLMTLGLAPLTLLLFHEVTPLGLVANWVAIPWVTLCVTPLALLGVMWPMAWQLAAAGLVGLQWTLSGLLTWGVPSWSVAAFPLWVGVTGLLGAALLCWRGPWCWRWWGLPLVLPALCWQTQAPPEGTIDVVVADVGQGQAILVRTARHVLLYDAGPRYAPDVDAGQRVVLPLLQSLGLGLDRLVLSHGDTDHTGGAQAVLNMHPQAQVMGSLPALSSWVERPGYQACQVGVHWSWDGVRFDVLHPDVTQSLRSASNARSCVLRIQTANASLLLTGDLEAPEEAALVARWGAALKSDIVLMPHHGSRTSSSAAWLDAVQPRWAWVQAGYRNRFGHPASDVLARYQARGITVLETARCGAILWSSQAPHTMQCERASRLRYWHHCPG
jgi:competence protein ComEC